MHHSDGRCLADDGRNCALQTCTFSNKHLQQQVSIELQCCRKEAYSRRRRRRTRRRRRRRGSW